MLNTIPAPQQFMAGEGTLTLDSSTQIMAEVGTESAAHWLRAGLARFAGIEVGAGIGVPIRLEIKPFEASLPETIGVRADGNLANHELHSIEITNKNATITGVSAEAVFRGATTLVQLAALNNGVLPVGTIIDSPRIAWRGLSFDTVRCFHPVETVKNALDLLALYKLNVFHFHLTNTEGWRFQVDSWPMLTEISGQTARNGRPGGYYTTEEFAEIVQYADDRFIHVVPEFDTPGHTAAVITAYPELANDEIRAMDPAMQYLHPDQPGVPELMRDVYTAMAEQSNADYVHIGGDEAIGMDHETFQRAIQLTLPIIRETGKKAVVWQEAARGGVTADELVQWWIPDEMIQRIKAALESGQGWGGHDPNDPKLRAFAELFAVADQDVPLALDQGASIILSSAKWLYLDTQYTEQSSDPGQNEQHERLGMRPTVYANGTVQDSYNWDPVSVYPEVPVDRIAGVEAAIWCERIENEDDLFFQLLPRLSGVAEKGWSTPQEWEDYRNRLAAQPLFWDAMGLTWFKSSVVW